MSESKHTPGPWRTGNTPLDGDCIISDASIVAEVVDGAPDGFTPAEFFANARLIAAAPELLEALEELHDLLEQNEPAWYLRLHHNHAQAAIAKARGEA